jgi:Ca2+:H+ antiporter
MPPIYPVAKVGMALLQEWPLLFNFFTTVAFLRYGQYLLADLEHPLSFTFVLTWLLLTILSSLFAVVRHAESLAEKFGEPMGTLVLTLGVTVLK